MSIHVVLPQNSFRRESSDENEAIAQGFHRVGDNAFPGNLQGPLHRTRNQPIRTAGSRPPHRLTGSHQVYRDRFRAGERSTFLESGIARSAPVFSGRKLFNINNLQRYERIQIWTTELLGGQIPENGIKSNKSTRNGIEIAAEFPSDNDHRG
jgi:hypothetical protein